MGVGASVRVLEKLVEETVHGTAAGNLAANVRAREHFMVGEIELAVLHRNQIRRYNNHHKKNTGEWELSPIE